MGKFQEVCVWVCKHKHISSLQIWSLQTWSLQTWSLRSSQIQIWSLSLFGNLPNSNKFKLEVWAPLIYIKWYEMEISEIRLIIVLRIDVRREMRGISAHTNPARGLWDLDSQFWVWVGPSPDLCLRLTAPLPDRSSRFTYLAVSAPVPSCWKTH